MRLRPHLCILIAASCLPVVCGAQGNAASSTQADPKAARSLTLEAAISRAIRNNGTVASAYYAYLATHQGALEAYSPLLPSLSASYVYNADRSVNNNISPTLVTNANGSSYNANANWRVFDLGVRNDNYLAARRTEESQRNNAKQILRQVLFNVEDQYFETLRATELQKVSNKQVERAQTLLSQTTELVKQGKIAAKDILQAKADLANATVTQLQSGNTYATDVANLESLIGLPKTEEFPTLSPYPTPDTSRWQNFEGADLKKAIADGVASRPDLQAQRESVRSLEYSARSLAIQAGLSVTLDATFGASYAPNYLENRLLTFTLSYPVFDGGSSRAAARAAGYSLSAARQTLAQAERDAAAQIETVYVQIHINALRIGAAKDAYDAALENYNAALESQRLGAATVIDVLTADVTLVTAESNQIQAVYDYDISEAQLRLVTGERMVGEPIGDRLPQYK